jgi:type IV secretory pathway VirB2 component (pilin)
MSTIVHSVIPVVITNLAGDYIETITAPTNLYGNEMGSHTWLDEVQDDIRGNLSNPEEWNAYCGGSWVSSSEI